MVPAKPQPAQKQPGNKAPPSTKSKSQSLAESLAAALAKDDIQVTTGTDTAIQIKLPGVISTRCPTLDAAIGRGGIPLSRLSIITGPEAGGKTTLALHIAAECQAQGGIVLYVDAEHKLDIAYAKKLGVNVDEMLLSQPTDMEGSFKLFDKAVRMMTDKHPDIPILGILDSINANRSRDEYEGEYDSQQMGAQARVMSKKLPLLIRAISRKPVALLFISQPRDAIGTVTYKNKIAGGNAPKFYAALVIDLNRKEFLKVSEKPVGTVMVAKVIKNQVAVPFKEAQFNIVWGSGIDYHHALLERGIHMGLLSRSGGWYEFADPNTGEIIRWQSMKGWRKIVEKRLDYLAWMEEQIKAKSGWG